MRNKEKEKRFKKTEKSIKDIWDKTKGIEWI